MARLEDLTPGAMVEGIVPREPVTIVSGKWHGTTALELTFKDVTGRVDHQLLFRDDEQRLVIAASRRPWAFDADGSTFRLVSEAYRIQLAALFDTRLAVHTSLVEPLPHQIMAVYERMLPRQPLRFLLADDPGAGKTIMAGLFIRELAAREDVKRCLIVCPGSLAEQWQDELDSKFQLPFEIATKDKLEAARTGNWFAETHLCIARLDKLSRDLDVQAKLKATHWDLVVVDEAHKMSATRLGGEAKYTKRYHLGQLLSGLTRHFLLMTATPHNGKEEDFQLFMALLDGDRFEGQLRDGAHAIDCSDLMRRLVKEQLLKFDGTPLFPERRAYTVGYKLSTEEAQLYKAVTEYVREEFNRADKLENEGRKGTVGFALTVLQRRLASSPEAIYQSIRRRRERLEDDLREARLMLRGAKSALLDQLSQSTFTEDELHDVSEADESTFDDPEKAEDEVVTEATAARTIAELETEIEILQRLEALAFALRRSGVDKKWEELSRLLQHTPEMFEASGHRRKLVIFTEHRDTLRYLLDRIGSLLGRPEAIVTIAGGMAREQRRSAEESFCQDKDVEILLATDAAGEGINLQRAHLMVNYDLPWNPNRLEQRFGRIHRIGQTEVCHLWNLLAYETREGEVYHRLLEKLDAQREALGGGRVYNVLGRPLFDGTSLRNLLIEAVRYGEQPEVRARLFRAVDNATDQQHVRDLLDTDALVRDSMDTRKVQRIHEEMQRAEAARLQPHYIQAFFMEAFRHVGGQISERERDRYEITRVPASLRDRDRQIGRGAPVLSRYERVTFEKTLINVQGKPIAAFICPGHPLLDALLDLVLEQHRAALKQGAILIDPDDQTIEPRALFYLEHSIRDAVRNTGGDSRTISRELRFIEIDSSGKIKSRGAAPYLDYRPALPSELIVIEPELDKSWLSEELENQALAFAAEHVVPLHLKLVREEREEFLIKTKGAVQQRLTREIQYWDHRAQELRAKEQAGKTPRINSTMARQKADDLEARLKRRLEQIDRERQISPVPPVVIGGAIVIPIGLFNLRSGTTIQNFGTSPADRDRIERLAVSAVIASERALGREPREMDHNNPGYDVESHHANEPGRLRFIEVKGKAAGKTTVTVSATQIRTALNKPDDWILAIVPVDGETAGEPRYIRRPFTTPPEFAEVSKNLDIATLLESSESPS